jgi:hypothetical protein
MIQGPPEGKRPRPTEPWYMRPAIMILGSLIALGFMRARSRNPSKQSDTVPQQPVLPASQSAREARRYRLRPEAILTWLSLIGLICYVITWTGYVTFYRTFSVGPQTVGVSYPALLIPAAAIASILVLFVAAVVALIAPLFMQVPIRAAYIHSLLGLVMFVVFDFWYIRLDAPTGRGHLSPIQVFALFGGLLGLLLLVHGLSVVLSEWARRRRGSRAHELRERVAADLRDAAPVVLVLLAGIAGLLLVMFVIYLNNAAEHAARDAIAEKPMFQSAGDLPADVLLNVAARPVEVVAVESRFRSFERQKLLYLGAQDGVYVLYDIVKKKTYLVPSGAIALQFSEVRS